MDLYKKLIFCLVWLISLYSIGILLFTKGFLLTRFVIQNNNTCRVNFSGISPRADSFGHGGCWIESSRKKAVIIVIDALRFDFVMKNNSISYHDALPYQNKLKSIHNLLETKPQNAKLYQFMADPPTTTLQRLKGLTTGSLPTFIDVASNFDSSAISEDNVIDQLIKQNKTIVFMGDDTWVNLFPDRFMRSYSFPSFNVNDLHTVDNGVITNLLPELVKNDWDVLIAHFLGVDHCGHRYGPNHPAMAEKLIQMDNVLKSMIDALDEDTVLFVLGDHGMTRTGDHGGDSLDELRAALFVYSSTQLTASVKDVDDYSSVSQIDLVPTLSLLLGIPIPFSNLGTIIPDLFYGDSSTTPDYHVVKALQLNAHQIRQFIGSYAAMSDEFPRRLLLNLETKFKATETLLKSILPDLEAGASQETLKKLKEVKESYKEYLSQVKQMCQDMWAKFDLSLMTLGIVLVLCTSVHSLYWVLSLGTGKPFRWQSVVIGAVASFWTMTLISLLAFVHLSLTDTVISLIIGCFLIVVFGIIAVKLTSEQPIDMSILSLIHIDVIPLVIVAAYSLSIFSNSYVVFEDSISAYFLQSLVAYNGYCVLNKLYESKNTSSLHIKNKKYPFDFVRYLTSPVSLLVLLVLVTNCLIRISANFRACREEQWTCNQPTWLLSLASLSDETRKYKNIRYFVSVACLGCFSLSINKWLSYCGNLNGLMPSVLGIRYLLPAGSVSLSLYWALQALPSQIMDSLPVWQLTMFPQIVYACFLVLFICVICKPLCLFLVIRSKYDPLPFIHGSQENVMPQMYSHLKANWRKHLYSTSVQNSKVSHHAEDKPPLVYGLATVFSSSQLVLLAAVVLLLFMLLGDGLAPSLVLCLAVMVSLLEVNASLVHVRDHTAFYTPWTSILAWSLLASEHFFSTGHQAVITTIQWQSAFHGFHGDFNYFIIPAGLILTNTFASYIIIIISLPLLLFWPRVRRGVIHIFQTSQKGVNDTVDSRGEFSLHEHSDRLWSGLFQLFVGFIIIQGLKVLSTMCCAMLHRRHLMVWKIFAPRFLFEGVTFLLIGPLCILVYLFVIRVNQSITKWTKQIDS